jgi:hypothetical protein
MPESATAAALGSKVFSIVDKFGAKNREKTNLISTFAPKFESDGSFLLPFPLRLLQLCLRQ